MADEEEGFASGVEKDPYGRRRGLGLKKREQKVIGSSTSPPAIDRHTPLDVYTKKLYDTDMDLVFSHKLTEPVTLNDGTTIKKGVYLCAGSEEVDVVVKVGIVKRSRTTQERMKTMEMYVPVRVPTGLGRMDLVVGLGDVDAAAAAAEPLVALVEVEYIRVYRPRSSPVSSCESEIGRTSEVVVDLVSRKARIS